MKYRTRKGVIEIIETPDKYHQITTETGEQRIGGVVFCDPAPMDPNHMNFVNEPLGAVLVFWSQDDQSTSPSFISEPILEVLE